MPDVRLFDTAPLMFKVCCIESREAARAAIAHGASALGFVSTTVGPPAVLPDEEIAAIVATVPPGVATFLLTASQHVDEMVELQRRTGANTLQLVDRLTPDQHGALHRSLPGIALVQVVHVVDEASVAEARAATAVHALLLDSGNPSLPVKRFGGSGRTHDWALSRRIRDAVAVPVLLAGGLTAENVAGAVEAVRPYGVDVCNGVRTDGALDEHRLARFAAAVRSLRGAPPTPESWAPGVQSARSGPRGAG